MAQTRRSRTDGDPWGSLSVLEFLDFMNTSGHLRGSRCDELEELETLRGTPHVGSEANVVVCRSLSKVTVPTQSGKFV